MAKTRRTATQNRPGYRKGDPIATLFAKYVPRPGEDIGPEGIEKLCKGLGFDVSDRRVLIMAWKMQAKQMGTFTQEEFERGLTALKAETIPNLKKALNTLDASLVAGPDLYDLYTFAFHFCITEPGRKILELDEAADMLKVAFRGQPHTDRFATYIRVQKEYKTINLDQWTGFYRFALETNLDCSNFDEDQAWPLILDKYVEWVKSGQPTGEEEP